MQGKTKPFIRYLDAAIQGLARKRYSGLILGPRQVGKTTLVQGVLKHHTHTLEYLLQIPSVRLELEANPSRIIRQVEAYAGNPYVFVDEAQKVPDIFDAAQYLIDHQKASFLLTGSSARKLKRNNVNLLPGRIMLFYLDPLLWGELGLIKKSAITALAIENCNAKTDIDFEDLLVYGSLPGIITLPPEDRAAFLRSYAEIYLEEEIRAEALSRNIGAFSRFLELAAVESGTSPNFTKLSNEAGVSQPSIKEFYRILEDTLVVQRVDPYLKNARKRIISSPRYYFFDIGVRNAIARLPLEKDLIAAQKGILFEHAVILEIARRVRALHKNYKMYFWRTSGGAEVDVILDLGGRVIPIEIKASKMVFPSELKGLKSFLNEYQAVAKEAYVITMGERKEKLTEQITALPWFYL